MLKVSGFGYGNRVKYACFGNFTFYLTSVTKVQIRFLPGTQVYT